MTSRASSGGAATAGGVDYQALVGAYMAVHVLAERAVSPLWDLPASVAFTGLWAESGAAVDDVFVTTSARGRVFIQAKRTVTMSDRPDSPIGAAFKQFVALYRTAGTARFPDADEVRALDPSRDRIVLATSATTGPLEHFIAVLRRLREIGTVPRPRDCTTIGDERAALARGILLVRRCWREGDGPAPSWGDIVPFLRLLWITTMGLETDQPQEQLAKYWLRNTILVRATEADAAWKILKDKVIGLAKRKSGVARSELQRTLMKDGLALRALRSYEADIDRLRQHTRTSINHLMRFTRIRYDDEIDVTIPREYDAILRSEGKQRSHRSSLLATLDLASLACLPSLHTKRKRRGVI